MSVADLRKKFEEAEQSKPVTEQAIVPSGLVAKRVEALQQNGGTKEGLSPLAITFTSERENDFFSSIQQHSLQLE